MNTSNIDEVENFVVSSLTDRLDGDYLFNNLNRTKEIIAKTTELLKANKNKKVNDQKVLIAAWFLNYGFLSDYQDHVAQSCKAAKKFLSKNGFESQFINDVCTLIEETSADTEPKDIEVQILKDANSAHYASKDFEELIELQRMEMENLITDAPKVEEWRQRHIEILRTNHRFYTDYANENWQEQKEKNLIDLVSTVAKAKKTKKKEKLKVKLKNESPERAIQSLYRTQLRNHIKLSDIADTKANILLSVNAIIISLLLANLIPRLDDPQNSYLIYPTVIFVAFSIASIIMSVLATRPKIENENVVDDDLAKKDTNYLFFGNFYSLELKDFKQKINEIIKSKESIYDSLTMDLYFLGKVLKKKYQLLRWTYTIFIVGIILSVLAFAIALKYYGMEQEILDAVTPDVPN